MPSRSPRDVTNPSDFFFSSSPSPSPLGRFPFCPPPWPFFGKCCSRVYDPPVCLALAAADAFSGLHQYFSRALSKPHFFSKSPPSPFQSAFFSDPPFRAFFVFKACPALLISATFRQISPLSSLCFFRVPSEARLGLTLDVFCRDPRQHAGLLGVKVQSVSCFSPPSLLFDAFARCLLVGSRRASWKVFFRVFGIPSRLVALVQVSPLSATSPRSPHSMVYRLKLPKAFRFSVRKLPEPPPVRPLCSARLSLTLPLVSLGSRVFDAFKFLALGALQHEAVPLLPPIVFFGPVLSTSVSLPPKDGGSCLGPRKNRSASLSTWWFFACSCKIVFFLTTSILHPSDIKPGRAIEPFRLTPGRLLMLGGLCVFEVSVQEKPLTFFQLSFPSPGARIPLRLPNLIPFRLENRFGNSFNLRV